MNNAKMATMAGLLLTGLTANVSATEADVTQLNERVAARIQHLSAVGLLPTALEIEVITGDIVNSEVKSGDITVEQAVEKYELTPTLARYIQLKAAGRIQYGAGVIITPPK
jgi:hypothetical protein